MHRRQFTDATGDDCSHHYSFATKFAQVITEGGGQPGFTPELMQALGDRLMSATAMGWLLSEAPQGKKSFKLFVERLRSGEATEAAFNSAFNVSLDSFYQQFEPWREIINTADAYESMKLRPSLTNNGE